MQRTRRFVCTMFALAAPGMPAAAAVVPVGPFVGDLREPLNGPVGPFGFTIVASVDVFGGAMTVTTPFAPTTYVHYWLGSSLNGDPVSARTGPYVLGTTQGPQLWIMHQPVTRIGSWFNNNSGADGATVEFFDMGGVPLGTLPATIPAPGNTWTWNGWQSDVPIGSMRITGNGLLGGFLWMDDMEMSVVPAPAGALVLLSGAARCGRRRR